MLLPEPGALEMNLIDGSSCPTYRPLSSKRPLQVPRGSVQPPTMSCRTEWYLVLCPLQSIMLVDLGATPLLAPAAAVLAEAALAASPLPTKAPMMMINVPAIAHSRAHRLPIVVLPGGSPERTTDMRALARGPGDGPRATAQSTAHGPCRCLIGLLRFLSTFMQLV